MLLSTVVLTYPLPKTAGSGRVLVYQRDKTSGMTPTVNNSKEDDTTTTTSTTLLIFCGGFPDDIRVFQSLAMSLASSRDDIVCGVTCPPGFDSSYCEETNEIFRPSPPPYDLEDMGKAIDLATRVLKNHVPSATKTVGVFHDWGSLAGSICANLYHEFDGIVYIDVLPTPKGRNIWTRGFSLRQSLICSSYTCLFAVTHAIQRHVSWWLAVVPFSVGGGLFKVFGLLPVKANDFKTLGVLYKNDPLSTQFLISMMYPYYQMYCNFFQGRPIFGRGCVLSLQTPILFLYGTNKRVNFHTKKDLVWMGQYSHMKAVAVNGAGHWLYLQEPHAQAVFQEIDSFLRRVSRITCLSKNQLY
jgi:pimeloyl-ACP methyl ester carboxylesterase